MKLKMDIKTADQMANLVEAINDVHFVTRPGGRLVRVKRMDDARLEQLLREAHLLSKMLFPLTQAPVHVELEIDT